MFNGIFKIVYFIEFLAATAIRKIYSSGKSEPALIVKRRSVVDLIFLVFNGIGMVIPLVYACSTLFDFADYTLPDWVGWTGVFLFAVAIWLLGRSHRDLGRHWTVTVALRSEHELTTSGVYKYVRHPMYLAHLIWAVAQIMILHNWIAGYSFLVVQVPFYIIRIKNEETMMIEHFGTAYKTYMEKTGRFIPQLRKVLLSLIWLCIFSVSWSQEDAQSTTSKLEASATISINSNGIAYIPAFSLDKPAIIGAFSLVKGRFSYDPQLSYGLDLRPWIVDNWLHYKIIDRTAFEFKVGGVISSFFSEYEAQDEVIWQAQKYLAVEFTGTYTITPKSSLAFTYLLDRGQDPGTVSGHFFNIQAAGSDINLGKKGLLSANLQLFYLDYSGSNDGLFMAGNITASLRDVPFSILFQAIQALASNIDPFPEFKWNVGVSYTL
jgi:protein-S-isoprenylcysteine O-methyltransferase Ste14